MLLLAAVLLVQGGWRPTVENITSFPKDLKPAGRAAALARLDPILPILKAALTTDAVEFQAQRSFDNDPWVPGWPWPRDISVFGYEAMAGGYEGEAATIITVFANDLDPVLMPVLDHPPTYVIRHQHVIMLRRDSTVPWKLISQREFGRRLRDELRRRATHDYQARVALGRLNADFGSLTDATMLLPEQYDPSSSDWPGTAHGTRAVVDLDSNYFAGLPPNDIRILVLVGAVHDPAARPRAARRFQAFSRQLDRAALRRLLQ